MFLKNLALTHFRNFESVSLSPSSSLNIIYGQNGSGKSSILEAIHLLGFGRSFRTNKPDSLINFDSKSSVVFAEVQDTVLDVSKKIGCSRDRKNGYTFKVDNEAGINLSQLVRHVPVQIFTPQSSDLVLGPPANRRKFVDWALFHVEHSFAEVAKTFSRINIQRNAVLRKIRLEQSVATAQSQLSYWDAEFADYGTKLNEYRKDYCIALSGQMGSICEQFMPEFRVELGYNSGWDDTKSLQDELERKLERDIFLGHCSIGPQKADIKLKTNGLPASEVLSRGQLRVLVSVLQLSQMMLFSKANDQSLIYLIDDIAAELDVGARKRFLDLVLSTNTQVFVTAIEKSQFDFMNHYNNKKVFHVEHDQVNEE